MRIRRNKTIYALTMTSAACASLCVLSPWAVPLGPVPLSLCTLLIYLCGWLLTPGRAVAAVAVYVLVGAAGLPVFSGFLGGLGHLAGPTGGYIVGYVPLAIGIAFGLMIQSIGYGAGWAFLMSLLIFAGSGQYLGVSLLAMGAPLTEVALLTFIVNFRHLVYGLSLLEKLRGMGWRKLYMMFSLTDETYALLSSAKPADGINAHDFYFWIALLDHSYWIAGSVIGAVAGQLLGFDTTGVDFAMTALFIVIAIDQWKNYPKHLPALLGVAATVVCLCLFGPDNMLVPALAVIVLVLALARPHLDHTTPKGADPA